MRKYEAVCSSDVLDELLNGERILLIDRATESIDSLDEISTKDLAIAIKAENEEIIKKWLESEALESEAEE